MTKSRLRKIATNKITGIIVTVLTFVVVFGAIFTVSNMSMAADSLPGIVNIRNDIANANTPYQILEIVPDDDKSSAQFGYLVSGQEPFSANLYDATTKSWMSWLDFVENNLETLDEAAREVAVNKFYTDNMLYVADSSSPDSKPVWYETYEEVPEGTAGAQMITGGEKSVFGWLETQTRAKGWNTEFSKVTFIDTYDNFVNSKTPYYIVNNATPLNQTDMEAGDVYVSTDYIYKVDAAGVYSSEGTVAELKAALDADPTLYAGIGDYYFVEMKQIAVGDYTDTWGPVVYEASLDKMVYMDDNAPYKLHIDATNAKGHHLTEPAKKIYYVGGFHSNEWFKKYVLDIDDAETANYHVKVNALTVGEITAMTVEELADYLSDIDFIYLNSGVDKHGVGTFNYVNGSADYDLDNEAVELLFEKICNEKTPCIVDSTLVDNADPTASNSRMYALACMLLQEDFGAILDADGNFDTSRIDAGSPELAGWKSTILTTNNSQYVNENVMVINSDLENIIMNFHGTAYSSAIIGTAYEDVLDEIELENLYRAADTTSGYGQLPTDIYKSTVVRYIINVPSQRTVEKKTQVNVLEIQPANVRYPDNQSGNGAVSDTELTPAIVRKWMNVDSSVSVNITTMNTMEFIGTIEDLNSEYDMIYIGADIYGLQRKLSGSTYITNYGEVSGYTSMDGLIYTNVGGLTPVNGQFSGHLQTDYVSTYTVKKTTVARYNGNDITAEKHNKLIDYINGAYPVVVSDVLCSDTATPNQNRVDNCTYLYSFLKEHLGDSKEPVFTVSEVEDGKNTQFKFYANRGKLSIGTKVVASEESSVTSGTAFVQPGTHMSGNDTTEGHVTFVEKENGKYYLKYKFTITNNGAVYGSTRYKAALFLDGNSDGKFSGEYEEMSDVILTHVASGNVVRNGELIAGEQYMLTRQVPETYSGILTWKVEVSQSSNKFIRDSVTGYTKLSGTQKAIINVLQVKRATGSPLVLETAIGNSPNSGTNNTLSSLVWGGYCNADRKTYAGITDEFQFKFTTMTNAQFNSAYNNKTLNLMNYDMLVLGFYDSYDLKGGSESDISYNAVNGPGGIKEYIDMGKSVLFAHDTTSVTAVSDYTKYYVKGYGSANLYTSSSGTNASVWGYNLNMYIRDLVGLDTYGITTYAPVKSGKDLNLTEEGRQLMSSLKNTLDTNGYYKIGLKALAYLPNSNKEHTVGETQGFLYGWMDWYWRSGNDVTYRNVRSKYNTDRAERVNEGQITTYPYYLDETIDITRTHHQYFTLDMNVDDDEDGETDLVVWYTMGGKEGDRSHQDTSYYSSNILSGFSSTKDANFDDTSEKDVMNNYYIYNKGNITYTGFGDFDNSTWLSRATIVEECKLFVNTLVAAYGTSLRDPSVTVYESGDDLTPTDKFYEYGDVDNDVAFRENSQRMYFTVNDNNISRGTKTATAQYSVALKAGATVPAGYASEVKDGVTYIILNDLKTYNESGTEVDRNKLECGTLYYVDIPTSVFDIPGVDGQNVNTFRLKTQTILRYTGAGTGNTIEKKTSEVYHTVEFIHVELFPLD